MEVDRWDAIQMQSHSGRDLERTKGFGKSAQQMALYSIKKSLASLGLPVHNERYRGLGIVLIVTEVMH